MSEEILNEIVEETIPVEELLPQRVNPFCVISKNTFGEYSVRDIQTNSAWSENPYGEEYAVVPDNMVLDIMATQGFCSIELTEDGTEVASFTALDIPTIPEAEAKTEPTADERIAELEEQLLISDELSVDLYESLLTQEAINTAQDDALVEIYEILEGGM